jgi:glycosyltransferase involved in cell wall biosynthesis
MKKVVFVNVGGGPTIEGGGFGFTEGGLAHALFALANLAPDYDTEIVCPNIPESSRGQTINYKGVKVVCLGSSKWVRWMRAGELSFTESWWRTIFHGPTVLVNYIKAHRYISEKKPDILIANGILASFLIRFVHQAPFKLGTIHHLYHAAGASCSSKHAVQLTGSVERILLRLVKLDGIAVVNPAVKDVLVKRGFCQDKIVVVGNGVNVDDYSFSANKVAYSLIYIGRLRKLKKVSSLIEVVSVVKKKFPGVILHIVGDGPKRDEVNKKIAELGVSDNVVMHGHISEKDKIDLLASSAVYVSNSDFEGFGIPLVEAMATGAVPVVSDIDAHRFIFQDWDVGYLVSSLDEMAARIVSLLSDETNRLQLAKNGRRLVEEKWTWAAVSEKYRELIQSL